MTRTTVSPQHELAVLDGAGLGEAADLRHGKRKPGSQQAGKLNIRADERGQQHFSRRNGDGLFARLRQRDVGGHLNILFLEDGFNEGVDVAHVLGADGLMLAGFAAGFLAESLLEQGQRELVERSVHDGLQAVIRIGLIGVQRGDVADARRSSMYCWHACRSVSVLGARLAWISPALRATALA